MQNSAMYYLCIHTVLVITWKPAKEWKILTWAHSGEGGRVIGLGKGIQVVSALSAKFYFIF